MAEFKKGQRVRVAFEAEVLDDGPDFDGHVHVNRIGGRRRVTYLFSDECEVIDDPASDPIGTVRLRKEGVFILRDRAASGAPPWVGMNGSWRSHEGMAGDSTVIGAVPGTPAAGAA